jgi:hypothetical protein
MANKPNILVVGLLFLTLGIFACGLDLGAADVGETPDLQATVDAAVKATEQANADVSEAVEATLTAIQSDSVTEEASTDEPEPKPEDELEPQEEEPPSVELVLAGCDNSFVIETGQPLELEYGHWFVREEYLEANQQNLKVALLIDDQEVEGTQQPPIPAPAPSTLCINGSITDDTYMISYKAQLDPLSAGQYTVKYVISIEEEVSDGFDLDGNGEPDAYGPGSIGESAYSIVVQDGNASDE